MALLDDNGDPIQFAIEGYQLQSDGLTHMGGPCLGIVLSVQHSDDKENSWYEMLTADQDSAKQASYLEASVLLIRGETHMNIVVDHCIIMQGKSSNQGPTKDEPSDYSEDVPNGCSTKVVEDFYADRRGFGIDNLDGDWVIVNFIGGLLTQAIITNFFPSPFNKRDSATKEQGRRYLLRRNNSEVQIDKDGNFHITHRVGQYIQMRDKKIVIKHREGQMFLLDDDGSVYIADKDGKNIMIDEDRISMTNGNVVVELNGEKVLVESFNDEVRVKAFRVNLLGAQVIASAGGAGDSLLKKTFVSFLETFLSAAATAAAVASAVNDGGKTAFTTFSTALKQMTKANDLAGGNDTKVLSGE